MVSLSRVRRSYFRDFWAADSGREIFSLVIGLSGIAAKVNFSENKILNVTPGAWRILSWQGFDPLAKRMRSFPAEYFGELQPFPEK